ncbi:hypothetical protein D3C76_1795840 [compost metagenome]
MKVARGKQTQRDGADNPQQGAPERDLKGFQRWAPKVWEDIQVRRQRAAEKVANLRQAADQLAPAQLRTLGAPMQHAKDHCQ